MSKKNIFVFTTTRADYGLLRWIIKRLQDCSTVKTYILVGGTHLSETYGYTIKEILEDRVKNIVKIPFLGASSNPADLISSVGNGLIQISEVFSIYRPDFVILLGDRYELFIGAIGALMHKVPIIHLHGGEITEGAIDEQVRHSITKLSHIHMPSIEFYAENISKMGEEDWRIHIVGAPGLENIKKLKLYSIEEIKSLKGIDITKPTVLCTYHPVTLESEKNVTLQVNNLLEALSRFDIQIVFTGPNAEVGSDKIITLLKTYAKKNKNKAFYSESLGTKLYLSIMKHSKAVVGNSSSGIIEALHFHIPTINIGNRQKGRYKPKSVIDTGYSVDEITKGIKKALYDKKFLNNIKHIKNPYGDGNTSKYIVQAIKEFVKIPKEKLLKKKLDFEVKKEEWHRYF